MKTPKKRNLVAASNHIIIQPNGSESGALVLSQGSSIKEEGTILEVGPEVERFKKGQVVLFNAWAGDEKEIDGARYFFLPESANCIIGIID